MLTTANEPIVIGHNVIRRDKEGRFSLTDLWAAAGREAKRTPSDWLQRDVAKEWVEYVAGTRPPKMGVALKTIKNGANPGTWADYQIAMAYAKWLSPAFHAEVNEVYRRFMAEERNPDLAVERATLNYQRRGKDNLWIARRFSGIATRKGLTTTLAQHGVKGEGFAECTNAIYLPLFNADAKGIKAKRNLPETASTRDSMSMLELNAVALAECLAQQNIENKQASGNKECAGECNTASRHVARAVSRSLNPTPLPI
jgi:hypothetical protein